jgi:prepilin-type N-terminal cleavage/methylation domain-containing protein
MKRQRHNSVWTSRQRAAPKPPGRAFTLVELPFDRLRVVSKREGKAFTLVELLVVIGVIALILAIVLPSVRTVFSAGSLEQGRNVLSAMLGSARGLAVESQSYVLVHVQIRTEDEKCWGQVLLRDATSGSPTYGQFRAVSGYVPQQLPGDAAAGEVSGFFVDPATGAYRGMDDTQLREFTTANVIFSPAGTVVETVPDTTTGALVAPALDTTPVSGIPAFASADPNVRIWNANPPNVNEPGVRVLTVFSYKELKILGPGTVPGSRADYLNHAGAYLCVNPHTGQLLPTK